MGTAQQHKEKAEHHLRFLDTIPDDYPDWLATVAFYASVEMVEGMMAERSCHSKDHQNRKNTVRRNYVRIHKAYQALYNASLNARYESKEHWLSPAKVREILIGRHLSHIRTFTGN